MGLMRKMRRTRARKRALKSSIFTEDAKMIVERNTGLHPRRTRHHQLKFSESEDKALGLRLPLGAIPFSKFPPKAPGFLTTDSFSLQYPPSPPKTPAPHS